MDLESRWGQLVSALQSGASAEDLNSGGWYHLKVLLLTCLEVVSGHGGGLAGVVTCNPTQSLCMWPGFPYNMGDMFPEWVTRESQREAALPFIVYPQCDRLSHLLPYVEWDNYKGPVRFKRKGHTPPPFFAYTPLNAGRSSSHYKKSSVLSNSLWPHDCSPPGSSVHGILKARILEWVAMPSSRDLPDPGIKFRGLLNYRQSLYHLSHQGSP